MGGQTAIYLHNDDRSGTTTMVPLVAFDPADSVTFYFDTNGVLTDYKIKQAKAGKSELTDTAGASQTNTSKPEPANASKAEPTNTNKTAPGSNSSWSFRGLLPPSTKENR